MGRSGHVEPRRGDRGAGWMFLASGLVICGAVVTIPAQQEAADLRVQLAHLEAQEAFESHRVAAYEQVIEGVRSGEADLARRLVSTQLHLLPLQGEVVLVDQGVGASVPAWVEASLESRRPVQARQTESVSLLETLATGGARLWVLAAAAVAIFVGVLPPAGTGGGRPCTNEDDRRDRQKQQ